ncbi:PilZ domain-containing protein [Myxococcota bacterium]|nr:PilZ domain-containing protein [Myxococcota bacterium]
MRSIGQRILHSGERVYLLAEDGSEYGGAVVERVRHGLIWLNRRDPPGADGACLVLERRIDSDAVYRAPVRIEILSSEAWALRILGDWSRVQRRQDVRVATRGIHLELSSSPEDEAFLCSPMVDLSAGGTALRSESGLAAGLVSGSKVHCRFTVPGVGTFDIDAEVIRVQSLPHADGSSRIALRFVALDPSLESEIRRWVLHVQARQAR